MDPEDPAAMSEYPDLDYVPIYPWVGEKTSEKDLYDTSPIENGEQDVDDQQQNDQDQDSRAVNQEIWSGRGKHRNEPYMDTDFHPSDENITSDESFSAGDSDFSSMAQPQDLTVETRRAASNELEGGRRKTGFRRGQGQRGGRKGKRGLRKPLEPSVEFKALHSQATMAFIDHDYEEAEQLTLQAILVNSEMYSARSLLSEIHMARGDKDKALTALFHGAHTRPRDTMGWLNVAKLLLEREGQDRLSTLRDAVYCFNRVIAVESTDIEARYQRAALNREMGYRRRAAKDYEQILRQVPHDTKVLRHLADISIDIGDVSRVMQHYTNSIVYYQKNEPAGVTGLSWSDVNIYAELYGYQQEYEKGMSELKALSRWLLGRSNEVIWEVLDEDDREWDPEDKPRRIRTPGFMPGSYECAAYGDGLPLELRVKLGVYRLKAKEGNLEEAMNHFEWLDPDDSQPGAKLFDYPDLFREAADALRVHGCYQESLSYYEPLERVEGYNDASYFMNMALCYKGIGMTAEAEECYQTIINHDEDNVDARLQMARLYEELGVSKRTVAMTPDTLNRGTSQKKISAVTTMKSGYSPMLAPRPPRQNIKPRALEKQIRKRAHEENAHALYLRVQDLTELARRGNPEPKAQWMTAARILVQDFKSSRIFFPYEKHMKFSGYSKQSALGRLTKPISRDMYYQNGDMNESVPNDYLGISFHTWLDIFLEYALMLALDREPVAAYEVISTAVNANIFYHSPDSMFLIHVCWFTCALIGNDEETLCNIARWFMKEYQFVTDGYRLFSILNRLCDGANLWYSCGPSQKYILRQLKAMDFSLVGDARSKSLYQERASYTTKDESGKLIHAKDMDIALLMLYGHILYVGKSYSYALNYFLRAYALDTTNPLINLSLALGYLHYAIKRQADNRHHLMMQGFAFLFTYYDLRYANTSAQKERNENATSCAKQEAEYNVARAYHMLGLTHLAIPYYQRCLALSPDVQVDCPILGCAAEDFAVEAAYALQGLWAASGEMEKALTVTQTWLVI